MAQTNFNVGAIANDGTGEPLRQAFQEQQAMNTELYTTKVDKVVGKELSSNDFTDANVVKLGGIEEGAEVNVQADWEQSDDTADDYIKNKPTELFSSVGYFHYTDLDTQTTPITILPDTNTKLKNDGLGAQTNLTQAPYGVSTLFNTTDNEFDFTQLSIGDTLDLRVDLLLTTTSANQKYVVFLRVGEGSVAQYDLPIFSGQIKSISSDNRIIGNEPFSIDYQEHIDNPATLYILSDDDGSVKVNGWFTSIIRKSVNIINVKNNRQVKLINGTADYTLLQGDSIKFLVLQSEYDVVLPLELEDFTEFWIKNTSGSEREVTFDTDIVFEGSPLIPDNGLCILKKLFSSGIVETWSINSVIEGGGGATSWGSITGDIEDQTDLIALLNSSIVDAPAIDGTGETILTFDAIRYHGKTTQTGDIELSLSPTGNLNGRVQVIDIDGLTGSELIVPNDWSNSNGVAFDSEKNNVIYLDYINGKVKYNITKQDLPDITAPTYIVNEITDIEITSAIFSVEMNEDCNVYWYLSTSSTPPSKATILAGTSSVDFGTITAIANIGNGANLLSLTTGVTYYLYSYAEDLSGNETAVQTALDFVPDTTAIAIDDFNSANTTNIVGRTTPVGGFTWSRQGAGTGTLGIVSNALKNTGVTLNLDNIYTIDVGVRNVDVSVTFKTIGTAGSSNLEFARVDDANRYYLTSGMQLRRVVLSNNTLVSAIGTTLANGDTVRCVLTSTTITVYKNGVSVYSGASDNLVVGTKVGLYAYQDNVVEFEDLIVY